MGRPRAARRPTAPAPPENSGTRSTRIRACTCMVWSIHYAPTCAPIGCGNVLVATVRVQEWQRGSRYTCDTLRGGTRAPLATAVRCTQLRAQLLARLQYRCTARLRCCTLYFVQVSSPMSRYMYLPVDTCIYFFAVSCAAAVEVTGGVTPYQGRGNHLPWPMWGGFCHGYRSASHCGLPRCLGLELGLRPD